ncbi:threonine/homoserine/homoserine lactone efflux protein [Methylopila capsulata]|uniref:Threonine transporter RhtB n=1 Tax=Methylopila capsulata TaxID=61654 RepID=A0A9W6IVG0_9HYPH|nr:LysE family translocator [Methylopila capsulata]MBM7853455.1 threonine/homoserine/homoserine lactone efflux protein [Methylopila capsulata]GLK57331.1 threonine transporter RhtB [Methylopila capsulata]
MLGFLLTALVLELTPGPNMGTLASLALQRGRRAGLAAVAGVALGLAIVGGAAALGLAALIAGEPLFYQALRWAGVGYLLYLAWDAWRDAADVAKVDDQPESDGALFVKGLIVNLLNPKAAVFYVAVLPTFVDPAAGSVIGQNVALAAIYVSVATAVHVAVVLLAARLRGLLVSGGTERVVRRGLALAMGAIALWFAFETA